MNSIFSVPWGEVELGHLRGFLASAGDEGLTWEAKGEERPRPETVRRAVCGFANAIGGYLIIGAERVEAVWSAPGVDFEGAEPPVWLDQVIRDGLRPVPRFDVRAWETDAGRHVAVVRVEPVAVPPCMTAGGEIYERVSGRTVKVIDPAGLAALFDRGRNALDQAKAAAVQEAERVGVSDFGDIPFLTAGLGLASTGKAEDISARLFTEDFAHFLAGRIADLPSGGVGTDISVEQEAVTAATPGSPPRLAGRAAWNGGVAVLLAIHNPEEERNRRMFTDDFSERMRHAADAAMVVRDALGGYGRTHVALCVAARHFFLTTLADGARYRIPGQGGLLKIQRWTDDDGIVSDGLIDGMVRELLRASGAEAWEPD